MGYVWRACETGGRGSTDPGSGPIGGECGGMPGARPGAGGQTRPGSGRAVNSGGRLAGE